MTAMKQGAQKAPSKKKHLSVKHLDVAERAELLEAFHQRNAQLGQLYEEVTAVTLYEDVFGDALIQEELLDGRGTLNAYVDPPVDWIAEKAPPIICLRGFYMG